LTFCNKSILFCMASVTFALAMDDSLLTTDAE